MRIIATVALALLSIIVMAVYLPMLYEKLFFNEVEKTHLFFSPVTKRFIYKEKIVGPAPAEAVSKSEDHHAEIAYRDENGTYYTRVEFEKRLPFIYYKNMELWGLLPFQLENREFEKGLIKKNRQVLELKPDRIPDKKPAIPVWPILESNPGQVRLVFPEDRFRMTDEAMVFINADFNTVDEPLTTSFTTALKDAGFVFPARSVNGKFTILKPFDEGIFLVDDIHGVFHVKRRSGKPVVVRTPIDPELRTRFIRMSENKRREYYGLLLDGDNSLHLVTYDNYRLIPLPLEHYDPDRMDFKLILNPLYATAVYSDDKTIRAVAMDRAYQPLSSYTHRMSRTDKTLAHRIYSALFPFHLRLAQNGDSGYLRLSAQTGGVPAFIGIFFSFCLLLTWHGLRRRRFPGAASVCMVALTGVYGLLADTIMGFDG